MTSEPEERVTQTHPGAHFGRRVSLRVLALFALMLLTCLVFAYTNYWITPILLTLLCLALLAELLHYIQRSNRDLARFLSHIEFDDYAQRMPAVVEGTGFEPLAEAIDGMIKRLGTRRYEQAQAQRTLESIIENVPSPLFSVHEDGRISIHNHAARRLFSAAGQINRTELANWSPELWRAIEDQAPQHSHVVRVQLGDDAPKRMALSLADIVVSGQRQRLISLQNISSDLEASELEAWEQMARVLAHEIMNSLTPVASMADSARDLLESDNKAAHAKAHQAIDIVARRADSLMEFVQAYRRFARLPEPTKTSVELKPLLERMIQLAKTENSTDSIHWSLEVKPQNLTVLADAGQLEQVMINLMTNAVQALHNEPQGEISIRAHINRNSRPMIEVKDNGPGVPEDRQTQVFVPYFSTKRGGTGVGLALARQVMNAHNGSISVSNHPQSGAIFRLLF